jgi:hypothetical protein
MVEQRYGEDQYKVKLFVPATGGSNEERRAPATRLCVFLPYIARKTIQDKKHQNVQNVEGVHA